MESNGRVRGEFKLCEFELSGSTVYLTEHGLSEVYSKCVLGATTLTLLTVDNG